MLMSVNTKPIYELIMQHPVATVLTIAVCLVIIAAATLFIAGIFYPKK